MNKTEQKTLISRAEMELLSVEKRLELISKENYRDMRLTTERRTDEQGKTQLVLRGYPIIFNEPTIIRTIFGDIEETVLRSAFDGLDTSNCVVLWNHNSDLPLGRNGKRGTRFDIDETGVFFETPLGTTAFDKFAHDRVESGIVDGGSFGFYSSDPIDWDKMKRTVTKVDELIEVSLTPFPAYKATAIVAKRQIDEAKKQKREAEKADAEKARADLDSKLNELEAM